MSAQWKSGDVAMVTAYNKSEPYRAFFDGKTWREYGHNMFCVDSPTSHRPLVVIDPADSRHVAIEIAQSVGSALNVMAGRDISAGIKAAQDAIARLAAPTPPKPTEPEGLGAVAEDEAGELWVSLEAASPARWLRAGRFPQRWRDLDIVRVLSEGVAP